MRKLILISVLALASVTAQAGQNRGLLASGEEPNERIESVNPREQKPIAKPEAAKPVKAISTPVRQASSPPIQTSKPVRQASRPPAQVSQLVRQASRPANRIPARGYENDEAEARRIAANYGVSW
jgi:hypothetical protein